MAKNAGTQAKKKATKKIPNIVSFDEFFEMKGVQKDPLTVYFNEHQWKTLTKGMKPVEGRLPKRGIRLALFTSPSIPGGFGTLSSGGGSRFMLAGGGVVRPDPSGADKPNPEDPQVPDPLAGTFVGEVVQCALILTQRLRCEGVCDSGKCRMMIHVEGTGSWRSLTITCQCPT